MFCLFGIEDRRRRIERINFFKRGEPANGHRFEIRIALVVIEIAMRHRRHHHIVPLPGRLDAAVKTSPRHHRSFGSQSALQDLVPADQPFALAVQVFFHALNKPALQFIFIGKPLLPDPLLTFMACFPACFGGFVAADMNVFTGKQFDHLIQNIFEKFEGLLVSGTENIHIGPVSAGLHIKRPAGAGELRIGRQHLAGMAGHFNLGNNGDITVGCVGHDLPDVFLCIITTIGSLLARLRRRALIPGLMFTVHTPGSDFGQFWVLINFDAPAVVVGQVPVKYVHFVQGNQIDVALDKFLREEMPRDIQVHAAPCIAGLVVNIYPWDFPFGAISHFIPKNGSRHQLVKRLQSAKQSGRPVGRKFDLPVLNLKTITLLTKGIGGGHNFENNAVIVAAILDVIHFRFKPCGPIYTIREHPGDFCRILITGMNKHLAAGNDFVGSTPLLNGNRFRNNRDGTENNLFILAGENSK